VTADEQTADALTGAGEAAPARLALTVVIPIYNEAVEYLRTTLGALAEAADRAPVDMDVVVVDDGSDVPVTDALGDTPLGSRLRIVRQENAGRLRARERGLDEVTTPWVLFLDARIVLEPASLAFAADRIASDPARGIFNAHVTIRTDGRPFGRFWRAITTIAWPDYITRPREMSFGVERFDHYPKGTTCLLVRTELFRTAMDAFATDLVDDRLVNDDTVLIRTIAETHPIWLSPEFACIYEPRTTALGFFRQVFFRGTTFYDGFSRPGTRFTWLLRVFPVVSIGAVLTALRYPRTLLAAPLLPVATLLLALRRRVGIGDSAVFSALTLPFAAVYSVGIWRGVLLSAKRKLTKGDAA
jgi:glycosyltransferase involved in cell wall biosynthesis